MPRRHLHAIRGVALAVAAVSTAVPGLPARAQAPGAIDPGVQLQQQLRDATPPPPAFDPGDDLKKKPAPGEDKQPGFTGPQSQQTIFLKAIRFTGNTAIREGILVRPFLPLIGKNVTFAQLQQAATESEAFYKKDGYITTRVFLPPQGFRDGNVIAEVVEGYIQDVDVRGGTPGLQAYIKKMLQPVVAAGSKKIFDYESLERQLLLVRDFGGLTYNVALSRGTALGASRLTIDLKAKPYSGGIDLNNNLPIQLGDWQAGAQFQYVLPASQPVKFLASGSYAFPYSGGFVTGLGLLSTPLGNQGFKADAFWAISSTASKDLYNGPGDLQTIGSSNYWSFGIGYPLILKRNSQLTVALRGTGQNSTNDLYLDGYQATDLSTDKIRAVRLVVDGYQVSRQATNVLSFQLSQGIGGLNDGLDSGDFLSNPYGDSNFTSAKLNLSRTQRLFNSNTLLTVKGVGQASSTPLPVPEAFTYGGQQYGRAFKSVYLLGDQGWSAAVELGQAINFNLKNKPMSVTPFFWYDYGYTTYLEGPLPNQAASTYGIGMRGNGFYNSTFELGWGMPSINTLNPNQVGIDNSIVYFNAGWKF